MIALRQTNSSGLSLSMRKRDVVASSMSKISAIPSTQSPSFLKWRMTEYEYLLHFGFLFFSFKGKAVSETNNKYYFNKKQKSECIWQKHSPNSGLQCTMIGITSSVTMKLSEHRPDKQLMDWIPAMLHLSVTLKHDGKMDNIQWLECKINFNSTELREFVNPDSQHFSHHIQLERTLKQGPGFRDNTL